jgi:hypothetical protein
VKKIDFFSAEKMAINGVNWHFSALPQWHAHFSLGIDAFNTEKISATQRSAEKNGKIWHKLALLSATAVALFH